MGDGMGRWTPQDGYVWERIANETFMCSARGMKREENTSTHALGKVERRREFKREQYERLCSGVCGMRLRRLGERLYDRSVSH